MPTTTEWTAIAGSIHASNEAAMRDRIAKVRYAVTALQAREAAAQVEQEAIRKAWRDLRKTCPHDWEHSFDGVESSVECSICGK
jgi:hypothetical protein